MKKFNEFSLNEGKSFWRIPKRTITGDLWNAYKNLRGMYETLNHGNDLKVNELDQIISDLQEIRKSAKEFTSVDQIKNTDYE